MNYKSFTIDGLKLSLFASDKGLARISLWKEGDGEGLNGENSQLKELAQQLSNYFLQKEYHFDFPLDLKGTEFQNKVWNVLKNIPSGEVRSYKDIALKVGGANYSRAVGMANNKNPLPIIIPCHRVVGSNNKLVGYALGLELKQNLLKIEGAF